MMEIITLTKENIEKEHICCAISDNKDCQVLSKKLWLSDRLDDGLVFKKGNFRGKCFIEYIPAEKAWSPICAPDFMYIDCLWVSGKYKGHGYSTELLNACISDSKAKGKKGLVALSSAKKMGFLADSFFLKHKGFSLVDKAEPHFELYSLPFYNDNTKVEFNSCVKQKKHDLSGFTLFYTHQCPFTAKYVPIIEDIAVQRNIDFKSVYIDSATSAQNAPTPFTTYSLFYNDEFITHEILSEKKFIKIIDEYKKI